jgi:threonine synthase
VSTGNPDTIADKICDNTESWISSLEELRECGRTRAKKIQGRPNIYHVHDYEIKYALTQFGELGIEAEPAGAAGMAILPRLEELGKRNHELIAVINTGNGIRKCAYT